MEIEVKKLRKLVIWLAIVKSFLIIIMGYFIMLSYKQNELDKVFNERVKGTDSRQDSNLSKQDSTINSLLEAIRNKK